MDELSVKVRKPYTIKKERERWTCEEHDKFLEGIKLYGRAWRKIQDHIGTKNTIQIRSHAQKFFSKVVCDPDTGKAIEIPPPRPKRKPLQPYPRKNVKLPLKEGRKTLNFNSDQENGSPVSIVPSLNPSNDNDNNSNHNSEDNNMKRGEQDNFGCESHRTSPEEENNNGSAHNNLSEKSDMESKEEPKDEVHTISKQCCISEQVSQNETLSSLNSPIQNPNPLPVWPPVLPLTNIPWWWGPYTSIPNYSMFINPNVSNIENYYNAPKMEAPLKFGEESNLSSFEDSGPIRFELKLSENSAFLPVKGNKERLIKGFIPYKRLTTKYQ